MKISFNRGTFNGHVGLICLCHVQAEDDKKLNKVVITLSKQRSSLQEKIVIVPYSRLDKSDKNIVKSEAQNLLQKIAGNLPNTTFLPFSKKAGFNLSVPADSSIDFSEI